MSTTSPSPPVRRRWRQFGLRALLILALPLSLLGRWVQVTVQEERAAQVLKGLGAEIKRADFIDAEGKVGYQSLGTFEFNHVRCVIIRQGLQDEHFVLLERCPSLVWLAIWSDEITPAGVKRLSRLRNLRLLTLHGTQLSDEIFATINSFPLLEELALSSDQLTDAGLAQFTANSTLTKLTLSSTNITDASVPVIKRMTHLKTLYFVKCSLSDSVIAELEQALPDCLVHRQKPQP